MATKAETFRYWSERSGSKKPKSPPAAPRGARVEALGSGGGEVPRLPGVRHESARAGKKALYKLELTEGRPSRKSTRKAANRQRTDAQMRVKLRTAEVRPAPRGPGR